MVFELKLVQRFRHSSNQTKKTKVATFSFQKYKWKPQGGVILLERWLLETSTYSPKNMRCSPSLKELIRSSTTNRNEVLQYHVREFQQIYQIFPLTETSIWVLAKYKTLQFEIGSSLPLIYYFQFPRHSVMIYRQVTSHRLATTLVARFIHSLNARIPELRVF